MRSYLVFGAVCVAFLHLTHVAGFSQAAISPEEYKIYGTVLKRIGSNRRTRDSDNSKVFVLVADSLTADDLPTYEKPDPLERRLIAANKNRLLFENKFIIPYSVFVARNANLESIAERDERDWEQVKRSDPRQVSECGAPWIHFYKSFPNANGYYKLSAIGFSQDRRSALVAVEGRGECWDSFHIYMLKRTRKGWKVVEEAGSESIA